MADAQAGQVKSTNRLIGEKSPYLLQHAHNPVDWYPWGEEAFEASRSHDRPIFLSVGYSACHWCHVMERESFENPAIAALLNREFVSIKVDREERPDVDDVYMTSVQMTTGSGGWPMSVFLLPDGRPFYGGTYFPPENRQGRIGFISLLTQLADAYRTRRPEVDAVAASIAEDLEKMARQRPLPAPDVPVSAASSLDSAVEDMSDRFDTANGGFGGAPKFPPHHALRLLVLAARAGNVDAPRMLVTTLDKMALGGIYDHVGGGFHRYATDAVWLVPHFEKMLYDNALLARVYAEAYDLTGRAAYARIARETCGWVLRDLMDDAGGFYAALDADSDGEEGLYYVWKNTDAMLAIAVDPAGREFLREYNFSASGNYRDEATGRATGANIPYIAIGAKTSALPNALSEQILQARAALLDARYRRVPPATDDKVITAWNGLIIGALGVCGRLLNEPEYIEAARHAADFCLTKLRTEDGDLMRRYAKGSAGLTAFLDDYAFLADGLLDLYEACGDTRYYREAKALAGILLARFWDSQDAGFFYSGAGQETLIVRTKDMFDGALPSPNGVAARVLVRLGNMPDGLEYRTKAESIFSSFSGLMTRAPQGAPTLIEAACLLAQQMEAAEVSPSRPTAPVSLSVAGSEQIAVRAGELVEFTFELGIAPGYHVNANHGADEGLIPTIATLSTDLPATFSPVVYPEIEAWSDGSTTLPTFQGNALFRVDAHILPEVEPGSHHVTLTVRCQPCSERECLAPLGVSAAFTITVLA